MTIKKELLSLLKKRDEEINKLRGELARFKSHAYGARGCLKDGNYAASSKLLDKMIEY